MSKILPKRLVETLIEIGMVENQPLKRLDSRARSYLAQNLHNFQMKPNGTEGYRTAEVSLGGVNTDALSSKTMMVKTQPNLFLLVKPLTLQAGLVVITSSGLGLRDGLQDNMPSSI